MRKSIKFMFLAVLAAGLLLSCEVLPEPMKFGDNGIRFSVRDVSTKTAEVTTATLTSSGFNVSATSGTAGSEVEIFTNAAFSQNGGVFSGGQFWPVDEPSGGVHFYASNAGLAYHASGATVSALNSTDVVCAYLPDPDFGEENELTFSHIFARLDTVKVVAESGYSISNVSIRVTPKTGGTYDLRAGAGHADGTGWSSPVTGSETAVATSVGSNVPDLYMVPGTYTMKVSWTATKGGSVENFTDETVDFALEAGKRSEVTFTLGGNATDMKFSIAVTPWAVAAISPAGHDISQPLTFEIISDGTIVWKCSNASIARTIYYKKNGGDWTEFTSTTAGASLDVVEGDVVEFYGVNTGYASSSSYYNYFGGTADFYAYGNLNSLLDYSSTLSSYCFYNLFRNSKIHSHPSEELYLPATMLETSCYSSMFYGCTSLATAPELPATMLETSCYSSMFYGCTSLATAPELPATTLASNCYDSMFYGCTGLTVAPELPATTLASSCYSRMFYRCTGLVAIPDELPATTLESSCYSSMFYGCTGLVVSPEISATKVAWGSCNSMFYGCTSLVLAPSELPATTLESSCYDSMFWGCTNLTTVPELPATTLAIYCYRNMFWGCTNLTTVPELPATTLATYCYSGMFGGCRSFTSAPELPATTLVNGCYSSMFSGCTSLLTAPELPVTTLVDGCYSSMFSDCTSLLTAPELPATTLASSCYGEMFKNCSSLTAAPELPATTLQTRCYYGMFSGCTNLTSAPALPSTTLVDSCYREMFSNCSSLTSAPELLATTLTRMCYYQMFWGCSNLSHVKCLATDISASGCLSSWLNSVKSTGTFVKHPDMASWPSGVSGIPSGWTVEDAVI